MLNILFEAIKIIGQVFWSFGTMIFKTIYELSDLPTTQYGLVKFIVKNNIVIFNNAIFTKIIMFITPLIVSHVVSYLTSLVGIKSFKIKEGLSILLYLMILYLFSSWVFWLIICILIFALITTCIIAFIINNKELFHKKRKILEDR